MNRPANPVTRAAQPITRLEALACGWALLVFTFATCLEIVLRKLGYSLQGIDELGSYLMAILSCAGFAWTLVHNAHTRIDIVLVAAPRGVQASLNTIAAVTLAALAAFMVWRAGHELYDSVDFKSVSTSPLQVPIWIPQSLWFAGLTLFALVACAYAAHTVVLLYCDRAALNRYYGPPSIEQEVGVELQSLKARQA